MTLQRLIDEVGYIVLSYNDQEDYEKDLAQGFVVGETINSSIPDDCKLGIIGHASLEEWVRQCELCGDPVHVPGEPPQIAYLKVKAE